MMADLRTTVLPPAWMTWILGCAVPMGLTAWLAPPLLPDLTAALVALSGLVLVWRHLTVAWFVWVLVAGLSMEMALADVVGPEAFQPTIAAVKGVEIALVALTIARYGPAMDWFNPAWGFAWIAAAGVVVGTDPGLTPADMMRSLVGSLTPFLLFFCRKPAGWGPTLLRAISLAPSAPGLGMLLQYSN